MNCRKKKERNVKCWIGLEGLFTIYAWGFVLELLSSLPLLLLVVVVVWVCVGITFSWVSFLWLKKETKRILSILSFTFWSIGRFLHWNFALHGPTLLFLLCFHLLFFFFPLPFPHSIHPPLSLLHPFSPSPFSLFWLFQFLYVKKKKKNQHTKIQIHIW